MELDLEQTIEREWADGNIEALPLTYYLLGRTLSPLRIVGRFLEPTTLYVFMGFLRTCPSTSPLYNSRAKNEKYTERYTYLSPRPP